MGLESDVQSEEPGISRDQSSPTAAVTDHAIESEHVEFESEEEDVDFNPFLRDCFSEEPSSSLSSELEVVDADVVDSHSDNAIPMGPGLTVGHVGHTIGNAKENEQTDVALLESCDGKCENMYSVLIPEHENAMAQEKEFGSGSGTDGFENAPVLQETLTNPMNPIMDLDDEDAICKRTRARYSLAGFSLDELETFLQETDDEDDIQNVDEEEVYRKFLAAVLQGENGDNKENLEGDDDDDDDDNDADFEIEIEEALESDVDECLMPPSKGEDIVRPNRRPETRQNRRKKSNVQSRKKLMEKGNLPLRPLLPVNAPITPASCMGGRYTHHFSSTQDYVLNGFTSHQIGQLHCLMYEHVQLLIQIYSLSVLEPSRQHIASQLKGLLSELLHKRDLVLAWRKVPYPSSCFLPSHVQPSILAENKKSVAFDNSVALSQGNDVQGCRWLPSVGSTVLSVMDVAPLKLVGRYIDNVLNAVREHQRRCVEASNTYLEKQPLFPLPTCPPLPEINSNVSRLDDSASVDTCTVSPNSRAPKKTLVATLVESTKKQSVALVSRQIAKLVQPFYPLFNPALFPHKPPSSAVANRFLFTDAEDELLAMGMMEYNNDWKAIQQRFLPCKSEHQIFVRAKNRCSSKASENPIKTVRKMKTSPLTEEEKARIHEGLKMFKLDWTSIWKFIVPYRDPNLLCRQWRIAIGTQKSYKADPIKKEKRRIYESNRRKNKATALKNSPRGSEKEDDQPEYSGGQNGSSEDYVDDDNEAYLHEAFLADWRPISSELISSKNSTSTLKHSCLPADLSAGISCEVEEGMDNRRHQDSQIEKVSTNEVSSASADLYQMRCKPFQPYMPRRGYSPSKLASKPFVPESLSLHRTRKPSNSNLVRLAPELPPVKLPPAVRVIPQASLRGTQLGTSTGNVAVSGLQNMTCDPPLNFASNLVKHVQDTSKGLNFNAYSISTQKGGFVKNGFPTEGVPDFDPQMHPLFFRTLEEVDLSCYPLNDPSRIPTFSFSPSAQHQMNKSLLQNPLPTVHIGGKFFKSKETTSRSSNLDFHPLLQRNDAFNANSMGAAPPVPPVLMNLELSRDGYAEDEVGYRAGSIVAQMGAISKQTSSHVDNNDLDLDIQLNSASRKRKVSSCEAAGVDVTLPSGSGQCSRLVGDHLTESITAGRKEKPGAASFAAHLPNFDEYSGGCIDDAVSDQDFAEIVMEEEELCDSDEGIENVEFEYEEMADSEGEDSDPEQIGHAQNKEQHLELVASGRSEETHATGKGRSFESHLVGPGNGSTSWLSLNSRGPHCSTQSKANRNGRK